MRFNESELDEFNLTGLTILRNRLNDAVGLSRLGRAFPTMIVALGIARSPIAGMIVTFKKMMNPVRLGET